MTTYNFKKGDKVIVCATTSALRTMFIYLIDAKNISYKEVTVVKSDEIKTFITTKGNENVWRVRTEWLKPSLLPNEQLLLFELT